MSTTTAPMDDPWQPRGSAKVTMKAVHRATAGHPWIYKSDIESSPEVAGMVHVEGPGGRHLGWAMCSPRSQITLRLLSRRKSPIDRAFFVDRLSEAHQRRQRLLPGIDAYRWVHGEADLLPGIFIDRYADKVVLQSTCEAADHFEAAMIEMVDAQLAPKAIVVRNDAKTRAREGLRQHISVVKGDAPVLARYREGNIELEVDLLADQKTGGFLDQSANHLRAAHYATGRALDCFTYHGGFALQLASVCDEVIGIDSSSAAITRACANAARAKLSNVTFREANAFDQLSELRRQEERFTTIVLDPPAFASGKDTLESASRAYKEINRQAMGLLHPHGILVTCSCSGRLTSKAFEEIDCCRPRCETPGSCARTPARTRSSCADGRA
ncbi:MAG: class I SAM-dependent rRNA methyltransferase [Myxococcota bacterium]